MKLKFIGVALLSCGISFASQSQPRQVRVCLQFIEVPHPVLTEMLAAEKTGGSVLHDKAVALSKEGKAKMLETAIIVCRSGQRALLESIREEIYPTEYRPPGLPGNGPPIWEDTGGVRNYRSPTAFETRNTGVTFEVEPTVAKNSKTIDLVIIPTVVTPVRLDTTSEYHDKWGDASIRMPVYETWGINNSLSVEPGKFELVSAITPKPNAPVPAVSRKILVFVRADIVTVSISQ